MFFIFNLVLISQPRGFWSNFNNRHVHPPVTDVFELKNCENLGVYFFYPFRVATQLKFRLQCVLLKSEHYAKRLWLLKPSQYSLVCAHILFVFHILFQDCYFFFKFSLRMVSGVRIFSLHPLVSYLSQ